ncbi:MULTISPECIES: DUF2577 domain-containing protein [unclassified Paenibacillus]|uniref:DUF2577 domain-containing protein n=1 Tax=unclassified Paenibacillus TaxID=185978 RepID=UPI0009561801|nr:MULTISPECIES: DUF2577 domain-containing protein [unclassified Paenibacillus]ASS66475.1 DUF2577 domain-containing protein [Paenibacillus sp. RUD330]SIQ03276.1 Protein of unknown function [Paenibacillus sp. RU4X]SIQ22969.1 Protein of unknown function [Paenibacillus sp. RU4T]
MGLNDSVKAIAEGCVNAMKLADVMPGVVMSAEPLVVRADQRLNLDDDFLIVPEHLTEQKIMVGGSEILLRKGLEDGDRVVLIRQQGALNFYVAGRLAP